MADINKTRAQVAEIILSVGDTSQLVTTDKTSVVAATNEVSRKISSVKNRTIAVDVLPRNPDPDIFYFIYED